MAPAASITPAELKALFAHADAPDALLRAFADGISGLTGELRDMGHRLQSAHGDGDWPRYALLLRQLVDKYIRTIRDEPEQGEGERFRDLLHHTLLAAAEPLAHGDEALAASARDAAALARQWQPARPVDPVAAAVRAFAHQAGLHGQGVIDTQLLMRELFDLLLQNVSELIDDGSWLQDQIDAVRRILSGPLDAATLEQTRAGLREVIYRQGLLRQGITDAKASMQDMMVTFVERLDGMASSTGEYHDRISFHARAVRDSRSIAELGRRMEDILQDTAQLQSKMLESRDRLVAARREAEAAEQRVADLERELTSISTLVRVDQLTGALNRRGLEELFERESTRAQRGGQSLCLALLDLDDFRRINAEHGHLGGDAALRHVVAVARSVLRGSDALARIGGEEFVVLMPDTAFLEATTTIERLLSQLGGRPATHEGRAIPVTFSAGLARWRGGESQDDLIARADCAMYRAKQSGKNRVMAAG